METDNAKSPGKEAPSEGLNRKRAPEKNNNGGSPPNKMPKTFNLGGKKVAQGKKAWQIRGQKCVHDIYVAYMQKSLSAAPEEPFLRNFVQHLRRNPQVRQEMFGIDSIVARKGPDGTPMPRAPYAKDPWNLFVARGSDVGAYQEWLENIETRINSDDFAGNTDMFLYAPTFQVTSYGTSIPKLVQEVMLDDDICDLIVNIHQLMSPYHRINIAAVPFEDYFEDRETGMALVQNYLGRLLGEE